MTATVNEVTNAALTVLSFDSFSRSLGLVVIGTLIVLLVHKELVRAYGGARAQSWTRVLDMVIVPVLIAIAMILVLRFSTLTGGSGGH